MANRRDFSLVGMEEVIRNLERFEKKVANKIIRIGLAHAIKPMKEAAIQNAAKESGLLKKSIGTKIARSKRTKMLEAMIGPRTGFGKVVTRTFGPTGAKYKEYANPEMYAHLVEYGTAPHAITTGSGRGSGTKKMSGQHPGADAKPFLRPAFDAHKGSFETRLGDRIRSEIEKENLKNG